MNTYTDIQNLLLKTAAMNPGAQAMANSAQIAAQSIGAPSMKQIKPEENKQDAALANLEAKHRQEINRLQNQMDKQRDENSKLKTQLYQAQASAATADAKREMAEAQIEHSNKINKERSDANNEIITAKAKALDDQKDALQKLMDTKEQTQAVQFDAMQQGADEKAKQTIELAQQKAKWTEELAGMKADATQQMAKDRNDALTQLAKDKSDAYAEAAKQNQQLQDQAIQQQQAEMERHRDAAINSTKEQLAIQQQQAEVERSKANMAYENDMAKQKLALEAQKNKLQQEAAMNKQRATMAPASQNAAQGNSIKPQQEKLATVTRVFHILSPGSVPKLVKVASLVKQADIDYDMVDAANQSLQNAAIKEEAENRRNELNSQLANYFGGYSSKDPTNTLINVAQMEGTLDQVAQMDPEALERWNKENKANLTPADIELLKKNNADTKYMAERRLRELKGIAKSAPGSAEAQHARDIVRKHEVLSKKQNSGLLASLNDSLGAPISEDAWNAADVWTRKGFLPFSLGSSRTGYENVRDNAKIDTYNQGLAKWRQYTNMGSGIVSGIVDSLVSIPGNAITNVNKGFSKASIENDNSLSNAAKKDILKATGLNDWTLKGALADTAFDVLSVLPFVGTVGLAAKGVRAGLGAARAAKYAMTGKNAFQGFVRTGQGFLADSAHALEAGKGLTAATSRGLKHVGNFADYVGNRSLITKVMTPSRWFNPTTKLGKFGGVVADVGAYEGSRAAYQKFRSGWGGAGQYSYGQGNPMYAYVDDAGNMQSFNARYTQAGWDPMITTMFDMIDKKPIRRQFSNFQSQAEADARGRNNLSNMSNMSHADVATGGSTTTGDASRSSQSPGSQYKAASIVKCAAQQNTTTAGNATLTRTNEGVHVQDGVNSTFAPVYGLNKNPFITNGWSRLLYNYGPLLNQQLEMNIIPTPASLPYNSHYNVNPLKMYEAVERAIYREKGQNPYDQSNALYNALVNARLSRFSGNTNKQ